MIFSLLSPHLLMGNPPWPIRVALPFSRTEPHNVPSTQARWVSLQQARFPSPSQTLRPQQLPTGPRPTPRSVRQPSDLQSTRVVRMSTCRKSIPTAKMMTTPTPRCSPCQSGRNQRNSRVFSGSRMAWKLTPSLGQSRRFR